ncbi:MAG: Fic family protein [Candidatus Kaiserbacteria bacterium]|nr:Fic family protein [Candidatus Kaiserbacteria bacterium]
METSSPSSQESKVVFFSQDGLLELYEEEYNEKYLTEIFGSFLPTEKDRWIEGMDSVQRTVETRVRYVGSNLHEAAARIMFSVIKGHKLSDGNKRSSILCMVGFYNINGYRTTFRPNHLYRKTKEVAALDSQTIDDEKEIGRLAAFLRKNVKPYDES